MYTELEIPSQLIDRACLKLVRWLARGNDFFCIITDEQRCVQAAHRGNPDLLLHLEAVVAADDLPPRWPEELRVTPLDLGQVIAYTSEVPIPVAVAVCRHLIEELLPRAQVVRLRLQGHDIPALDGAVGRLRTQPHRHRVADVSPCARQCD